jgi:hypothetical protein
MWRIILLTFLFYFLLPSSVSAQFIDCNWDPTTNPSCTQGNTCPAGLVPERTCQQNCERDGSCNSATDCIASILCVSPSPVPSGPVPPTPTLPGPSPGPPPLGCSLATRNICSDQDGGWVCLPNQYIYCPTPNQGICCDIYYSDFPICPSTPPTGSQCTTHDQCVGDLTDNGIFDTYCGCIVPDDGGLPYCQNALPGTTSDGVQIFCDHQIGFVSTAIGCIPASQPLAFINLFLTYSVRLAAILVLLSAIQAGFIFITAAGDAKKVAQARDILSRAVMGVAIIALSVVLLNFLGVHVLGLHLFGFSV